MRIRVWRTAWIVAGFLFLSLASQQILTVSATSSQSYVTSGGSIRNVQVSSSIFAGATDSTGACVKNAKYNNHFSESWITVDPTNPEHLVGMSKFFFDPQFYLFHVGAEVSWDGGNTWRNGLVQGFDCRSAPRNSWTDTTDPVVAFDSQGSLYSPVLAFNLSYNSTGDQSNPNPVDELAVVKSTDGGLHWKVANQGQPIVFHPTSNITSDKQWIAVDSNPDSPFADFVYVGWTVFDNNGAEIWFSMSKDHGLHFTSPVMLSSPDTDGPFNTEVFLGTSRDGTLYMTYASFPSSTTSQTDIWLLKSIDGGLTFSGPKLAASFLSSSTFDLQNTSFRDGIAYSFAVNPANGHLFLALEVDGGSGLDIQLTSSFDRGASWSKPVHVNDKATVADGTDQFQPTVAASPSGTVAVGFYDRRLPCQSHDPNILPSDAGRTNFCINTSLQFYKDNGEGLQRSGSNIRVSRATWDPQNPGRTTHQLPRPGGPKGNETFIGDYFGLALSGNEAYVLFASNYDLGRNHANNQEQFLAVVPVPSGRIQEEIDGAWFWEPF